MAVGCSGDLRAFDRLAAHTFAAPADDGGLSLVRTVMDLLPVGVLFVEGDSPETAVFAATNSAAARILGGALAPETRLAAVAFRAYSPDRQAALPLDRYPVARALFAGEETHDEEIHILRPDGSWRVILANSMPLRRGERIAGAVVTIQDITERHEAEAERERLMAELDAQRQVLQSVVDHCPVGLAILTGPDHRYAWANPALMATARGRGELVGRTVAEVWPETRDHESQRLPDQVYRTGQPAHLWETAAVLERDGKPQDAFFDISCVPVGDAGGQVTGIVLVANEITEQVRARKRVEELAESQRAANEELQAQSEELAAAYEELRAQSEELQAQSEELGSANEELQAQSEELAATNEELQAQFEQLRAAGDALRLSEERLRAITDHANAIVWLKDLEGRFLVANRYLASLLGRPQEEIVGRTVFDLFPGDVAQECAANDAQVLAAGEAMEFEETVFVAGQRQDYMATRFPLRDSEGRICSLGAICVDITERNRMDVERHITLEFLRLVNDSSTLRDLVKAAVRFLQEQSGCDAVGVRLQDRDDFPYFEARGFLEGFVEAESSLCGRDAAGAVRRDSAGNPVLDCMCGNVIRGRCDTSKPFFTAAGSFWTSSTSQLLASTSEADRLARTRNRCNGEGYGSVALIPLRVGEECMGLLQLNDRREGRFSAEVIAFWERLGGYLAVALAKLRAEETLRAREAELRLVMDATPALISYVGSDGHYRRVNKGYERRFGLAAEEIQGRHMRDVLGDRIWQEISPYVERALAGEQVAFEAGRSEDGWVHLTYTPDTDSGGKVHGFVAHAVDITERKRLEEELRQAQKMEAVGRLAGGVAHDFNNLLVPITTYSEMLCDALDPGSRMHRQAVAIGSAAERAAGLTRQLLAFSRKQIVQPRVMDLNATVAGIERMLRRLIGEDVLLNVVAGAGLGQVEADPGQIEQVLMNLAVNARDAMPEGGRLTIETHNTELDASHTHGLDGVAPGRYVMLAVSDTGCGMDAETLSHVFEPFFTTKEQGKGTGLGLSTVYGIVRQSRGEVRVYSEPGVGTTFRIYLPRVDEPAEAPGESQDSEPAPRGAGTVLLVEDDDGVRAVARTILEAQGYTVIAAANGEEALRAAEIYDGAIALLLTDVVMPGMSGRQLADEVLARRPGTRTLFMSGYTEDAVVHHGVLEEGIVLLQKPFTTRALLSKVREVLDAPAGQ